MNYAEFTSNEDLFDSRRLSEQLNMDDDLLTEKLIEGTSKTPIGKLLKQIASMPEVRQEKVLKARRQISQGRYNDLDDSLDIISERILEDLLI